MKIAVLMTSVALISTSTLVAFFMIYPAQKACLNDEQVRVLYRRSQHLDAQGKLQSAREGYKQLDLFACNRSKLQSQAIQRSRVIAKNIHQAYDISMQLAEQYRQNHGKYPRDLGAIREFVPNEYLQAFNGFRWVIKEDGSVDIVTGLYGSASFSLK